MYHACIKAIQALAQSATTLPVAVGPLAPTESAAVTPAGGAYHQYFSGARIVQLVSITAKADKQGDALAAIDAVHAALMTGPLPRADNWQVTGITVKSPPVYAGRENQTGPHIYSSSVEVRVYMKGGA